MKSHTYRAAALVLLLALWCAPAVWAEDTTTASSGSAGSFQLEQVYVNAPELDVYFYATDANGDSYSPIVVQAQEVEATLGDRKLDTGMIGVADDPICYIIALDNSSSIDAEDFHKMRTAIWKLAQTKQEKDQIMVYTLAGGVQCALPATNDKAEIFNTLRTIEQSEGAIDLTGAAASLAADIRAEYQSLAPRKAAFICTDATQVMANLALLGGTLGTDQSSLNMAMYTFICTAAPERLESMTQMANGKVVACRHEDLAAEMQAKQTWFAQALTLRTEVQYTRTQGESQVSEKPANSRALGIKPYSTRTESAFLENLNHALDNALLGGSRCVVHKEVPISQVFSDDAPGRDLFYTGRFDFVVYQKQGREELPVLAIELDGLEHHSDPAVQARDRQKDAICREHGFELIRVENSYARRYHYIKDILIAYFKNA